MKGAAPYPAVQLFGSIGLGGLICFYNSEDLSVEVHRYNHSPRHATPGNAKEYKVKRRAATLPDVFDAPTNAMRFVGDIFSKRKTLPFSGYVVS